MKFVTHFLILLISLVVLAICTSASYLVEKSTGNNDNRDLLMSFLQDNYDQLSNKQQVNSESSGSNEDEEKDLSSPVRFSEESGDREETVKSSPSLNRRSLKLKNKKRAHHPGLELCRNVNCNNYQSNGQVSKTWRMAQLTTCCPSFRRAYYSQFKKNTSR